MTLNLLSSRLIAATIGVAAISGVMVSPADAKPLGDDQKAATKSVRSPQWVPPVRQWADVYNLGSKVENSWGPIVGRCSPGSGGSCAIGTVKTVTTTVSATLGADKEWVSAEIGFSASQSSSTSATCSSRKMASNEVYVAYALGTRRSYSIRVLRQVAGGPITLVDQKTNQTAWQPYSYPAVACRVIKA